MQWLAETRATYYLFKTASTQSGISMQNHIVEYHKPRSAIILTALADELRAVVSHLSNVEKQVNPPGTIYRIGTFEGSMGRWKIVVVRSGPGNTRAADETLRSIMSFNPDV